MSAIFSGGGKYPTFTHLHVISAARIEDTRSFQLPEMGMRGGAMRGGGGA